MTRGGGGVNCNRLRGKHYNKVLALIRLTSKCNYKKDETAFFMHSNNNVKTTTKDKVLQCCIPRK